MKEIWKDIKGYEGLYQVSNLGRVKSFRRRNPIILKQNCIGVNKKYKSVCLGYGLPRVYVHRLVAEAFLDNPNEYKCVMHLDNNGHNNRLDNLKWGSHSMNIKQCVKDGRHKGYENGVGKMRHEVLQ